MKRIARTILVVTAMSMMSAPAIAADTEPVQVSFAVVNPVDAPPLKSIDQELAGKRTDFESFAKWKVRELNSNHRLSRSRMEIVKQADGTYLARYHEIDDSTLSFNVRRSQSKSIPFVAVLSYREQVYESSASAPDQFGKSRFTVVKVIPNRHIFSYQKGRWN